MEGNIHEAMIQIFPKKNDQGVSGHVLTMCKSIYAATYPIFLTFHSIFPMKPLQKLSRNMILAFVFRRFQPPHGVPSSFSTTLG